MTVDRALNATLEKAGVAAGLFKGVKILSSSGADKAGNKTVHLATNDRIEKALADGSLGICIHVTGGARALTDPIHRSVCTAIVGRGNDPFTVLYNVPAESRSNRNRIVEWNLQQWAQKGFENWRERFQAIDLVGHRSVDLKAYDASHEIQFSVFGNRFIQIQGEHSEGAKSKPVWLIQSERINEALTEQALKASSESADIDESLFREFSLDLHSLLSRYLLRKVASKPGIDRDGLLGDPNLTNPIGDPPEVLDGLHVMDFIVQDEAFALKVTDQGREFLSSL